VSGRGEETRFGVVSGTAGGVGERLVFHHVVRADDTLTEFHRERAYFTVCGQVLRTDELPSSLCACSEHEGDECPEVMVYCLACLREAASINAEWGAPVE